MNSYRGKQQYAVESSLKESFHANLKDTERNREKSCAESHTRIKNMYIYGSLNSEKANEAVLFGCMCTCIL